MRGVRRRNPLYTNLLSECPDGNHNRCKIVYYNKYKSHAKEMCMCSCHEHAKPPTREKDPVIDIAALKDVEPE
jgi:hypothetical protein